MSIDLFTGPYTFRCTGGQIEASDEKTTICSLSGLQMKTILSHLQQNVKNLFSLTNDRGKKNLFDNLGSLLEKLEGDLAHVVQRTVLFVQGTMQESSPQPSGVEKLVNDLFANLQTQGEVEEKYRKLTIEGLHLYHQKEDSAAEFSQESEELGLQNGTAGACPLWALAKTLIHEVASEENLSEKDIREAILDRLKTEKEDLLYLLHLTVGGLLKRSVTSLKIQAMKRDLQDTYEKWESKTADEVAHRLGKGASFEELLRYVQDERQKIVFTCYHIPPDGFGRHRELPLYTPVEGKYLPWLAKILEAVPENDYRFRKISCYVDLASLDTSTLRIRTVYGFIGDRKIPLTSYLISTAHQENPLYREIFYYEEKGTDAPDYLRATFLHTHPHADRLVIEYLNHLTREYLNSRSLEKVAEMHWWFSHLCPLDRGSAAAGEILFKGLLKHQGRQVQWNRQKPPDLVLLTSPTLDEGIRNYCQMDVFKISSTG